MNIDNAKNNLLQIISDGRILLDGKPLNLKELAELQQNVLFLVKLAEESKQLKECKKELEPTD